MSYKWAAPNIYLNTDNHRYYVRVQVDGKAIWKSTGETNLRAASERARELLTTFKDGGPQAPVPSIQSLQDLLPKGNPMPSRGSPNTPPNRAHPVVEKL